MYCDILVKAFYVYTIIKMPALFVLSVNNRYTGLVRANTRYGKSIENGAGNRGSVLFK